jgi:hypothetical protein
MSEDDKSKSEASGWMNEKVGFEVPRWLLVVAGLVVLILVIY